MTVPHTLSQKLLAEFVGTFFLIAAGVGIYQSSLVDAAGVNILAVAFAHGLAIAIGISAVGHISGGHLNPAVTLAMMAFNKMNPVDGLAYIAAQLAAGFAGAGAMMVAFGVKSSEITDTVPALGEGLNVGNGIMLEAIATFLLVWVVFATAADRDGAFFKVAGLPIGFAVVVGILMIGPAAGAALNPARWFGPALVTGTWDNSLVWTIGPIVGGLLAGGAYMFGIRPRTAE